MSEEKPAPGRKLGDEWADWDGDLAGHEGEIRAGLGVIAASLAAYGAAWLIVLGTLYFFLYPGLVQRLTAGVALAVGLVLAVLAGAAVVWAALLVLSAGLGVNLAGPLGANRAVRRLFSPGLARAARWLGISRDRLAHAELRFANRLTLARGRGGRDFSRRVLLVPRCLDAASRQGLKEFAEARGFGRFTADGGERARQVVIQERPDLLLAVACERDLLSGLMEIDPRITVLVYPNRRPHGPCQATTVDLAEIERETAQLIGPEDPKPPAEPRP